MHGLMREGRREPVLYSTQVLLQIDFVPEDSLRAKWSGASDPIEKSFAGLMLYYTMGDAIDMTSPLRWCPINLAPVRQLAAQA